MAGGQGGGADILQNSKQSEARCVWGGGAFFILVGRLNSQKFIPSHKSYCLGMVGRVKGSAVDCGLGLGRWLSS